ncbi:MAG: translation initiation factor IF-3 [Coriobacteriales bacterium]|nr:translation initiation factor IF-3 [Coriobacteriales bacterium]
MGCIYLGGVIIGNSDARVNDQITAPEVRLIGVDGGQLGIFENSKAQAIAENQNLDLVEISPNADPPVCKIMNYSKYLYEQEVKAKAAKKKQTKVEIKEMKFRPKIDKGDYETKKGHILRFLSKGAKVKITIMFRGREMVHPEQGLNILERLADDLADYAVIEQQPKLENRNMHMLIAPIPKELKKKAKAQKEERTSDKDA